MGEGGIRPRWLRRPAGPALYGSDEYVLQAQQLIDFSANLTDEQKMITEHWANGPHSELPPGHWDLFIPDAADQAGISRGYGGIHFEAGDLVGRAVGDLVGYKPGRRRSTASTEIEPGLFEPERPRSPTITMTDAAQRCYLESALAMIRSTPVIHYDRVRC